MAPRVLFAIITAFWLTMNFLLWKAEFGERGGDMSVPLQLVWRKILTAPDASSLSVYQKAERMGYCEISTGVGQQMAAYDEDKPPPEGFAARPDYQLHIGGNISLGDFTNRLKFDGRALFDHAHRCQELNLKVTSRLSVIEIHSVATNESATIKLSNEGVTLLEREIPFAELQSPDAIVRLFAGSLAGDFLGVFDLSEIVPDANAQKIEWEARRTRVKIGAEAVPVYRLETVILGRPVIVDVSTLGEILRVQLPGDIIACIDEWSKP